MSSINNKSNGTSSLSTETNKQQILNGSHKISFSRPKMCIAIALIGLGVTSLLVGFSTYFFIIPTVVKSQIIKTSQLVEGSLLWKKWTNPEYEIKFKLFVYSVKNPDEIMSGSIPEISGSGPYTFDKKLENKVVAAGNGTVKYRRFFTYNYNENDSCQTCILENRIWVPNMIYQKFVEAASTEGMKAAATTLLSQTAFLEVEVDELLFKGYKDPFLDKVCEIPFMNFVCETILDIPDRIGLFYEKNNTGSKIYEIDDGTDDSEQLGNIISLNNNEKLDESWWSSEESRKIKGTDGTLFKPFIKKTDKLYVFVEELCRSIWLEFQKEIKYKGLIAYRFVLPPEVFDTTYEGNEGFCNPSEKKFFKSQVNDTKNCPPRGILNISKCQRSQPPISISLPNFFYASDEVKKSVKGLNKTDELRDSIIVDIEPRIGAVLHARKVSQVNVEMWKGKNLSFPMNLEKIKSSLIPVLIVHEISTIDNDSLETIRTELYNTEWYAYTLCRIFMIFGIISIIIGIFLFIHIFGKCHPGFKRKRFRSNGVLSSSLPPYVPKGEPKELDQQFM